MDHICETNLTLPHGSLYCACSRGRTPDITQEQPASPLLAESTETDSPQPNQAGKVKRPRILPGKTYRSENPNCDYRSYITACNYCDLDTNEHRPFEIFISNKNAGQDQWTNPLARLISLTLKENRNLHKIIAILKDTKDTGDSGYFSRKG